MTRRVVTGQNASGESIVLHDDDVTATTTLTALPSISVADLWVSSGASQELSKEDVSAPGPEPGDLQVGSHIFRVLAIKPDSENSDPLSGVHKTETVDYVIVLDGEITCILDSGQVTLSRGDVLVQRGTSHAWSNLSGRTCQLVAVLMDARSGD